MLKEEEEEEGGTTPRSGLDSAQAAAASVMHSFVKRDMEKERGKVVISI